MLLENKHIFIIEDNLQNRIIFQVLLSKHGANLTFEPWGSRALLQLKFLKNVDLIILDLMLAGGISGYDVFDQIRAVPEFNQIPIVAVSAADCAAAIPEAQKRGLSGFIAKPIDDVLFPQQMDAIIKGEHIWYAGTRVLS
jgi:CheY-like chemotaxis protein